MSFEPFSEADLRQRRGEKWHHYPDDVLAAWVADMDFVVARPIRDALSARIAAADFGYPRAHRATGLPDLFAERVAKRFGWHIEARDVIILSDVVQGLYLALETLTARGDGVVIQTPIYPPFLHAAHETGRRAVHCPLVDDGEGYVIDFDQLEAAIDADTRLIMLCNPHNPSGRVFTRAELERIAALAVARDLVVVSDEIHADLVLDERPHIPIAALGADIAARTVTLMSASKAFNIAGLCMAFAHFGSRELKQRFGAVPAHARGGTNTLAIAAVDAAWRHAQPWLDEVLVQLRRNRDHVAQHVATHWPGVRHHAPEATYLAWLDMRALGLAPSPQEFLLEEARVALNDGRNFGPEGEGFVRLNFATSPEMLDAILARLDAALEGR
ncbi:MAG: pyridoxal phosphate-dependent aminotransferase [Gammaproteobacteria bacterium]|nr:pyridoxal phosphate-dependent aminotransferase [Gammaproteobacteria bacterium]